jgi:hypothetical protein
MNITLYENGKFVLLDRLEDGKTYYIQAVYIDNDYPLILSASRTKPKRVEEGFIGSDFKITKQEDIGIWIASRVSTVNIHIEEIY